MKRIFVIAGVTAAAFAWSVPNAGLQAAPLAGAPAAGVSYLPSNSVTPVFFRRHWGHRGGFGLYFGGPFFYDRGYYGRRCWWSHRWHRRVCRWY